MLYSRWEKPYFSQFINEVMDSVHFEVYAKLFYSPYYHQQHVEWSNLYAETEPHRSPFWTKTPRSAQECFKECVSVCQSQGPAFEEYMWLQEYRPMGKSVFHVLMAHCFNQLPEDFVQKSWKEVSGCVGFAKEPEDRIRGLLNHLVMKRGTQMEIRCGEDGPLSQFSGSYTYFDFRP